MLFFGGGLMHFTFRPYLKAFPSSTLRQCFPTKSGFISTGGHALIPLKMGTENQEHYTTYGWILSLLHSPLQDQLLQILCLPLSFKTLLRRLTFVYPRGKSISCPNLIPLVCKITARRKFSLWFLPHVLFIRDFSKYPLIKWEFAQSAARSQLCTCIKMPSARNTAEDGCLINRVGELQIAPSTILE